MVVRVVGIMGLGVLAGCVTSQPSETVILSQTKSAFEGPVDGKWRKGHESKPIAILSGRAETTELILPSRAALEASCIRGKPRVRIAYNVGLHSGNIAVAYRFDEKVQQKGVVPVRGQRRNIVVIDYQPTAAAFLAELRTSSTLKVRAQRPPFEMHDAHFKWDPNDKILKDMLAACNGAMLEAEKKKPPASDDDDDDALDGAVKDVTPEG